MAETTHQPESGGRLALCADAFLYTGVIFLLTQGLTGMADSLLADSGASDAVQGFGVIMMVVSLVAGVVLAWHMHGHKIRGRSWLGMLAGIVVAGPLTVAAFLALFSLGRYIPNPFPGVEGPWGLVLVLLIAVVAFLAKPLVDAVRDLSAGRRAHVRLDWVRLGAFAIVAVTAVATATYGVRMQSEVGEVTIFMVPIAAASACAVLGVDLIETWRARKADSAPPTAEA